MGLFDFLKGNCTDNTTKEEQYGNAWRMIVGNDRSRGLAIMKKLDEQDYIEGTIAFSMFQRDPAVRKSLLKKAAEANHVEGLWEYSNLLPHSFCPDLDNVNDKAWVDMVHKAAELGSVDAMNEMGNICNRLSKYAESMLWFAMANALGQQDGEISMSGIAQKWKSAGCPYEFDKLTENFDKAKFRCAIAYLEMHAGMDLSVSPDETIKYVLDGTPIAAYLTGDIFESLGNDEMAYKMYNAIAFENDPHGLKCYADMLFTGKGTRMDRDNAIKIYQKAAELGEREAMFTIGEFTKQNNKNLAAYWYGLAHTRGYQPALVRLKQISQ